VSSANVELVRRIYEEGMMDRHQDRLLELMAPNVRYVNPPDAVDAGTRMGSAEVAGALGRLTESFEWFEHDLKQLFDGGDVVVAHISFKAKGRASGAEAVHDEVHTWTIQDGRVLSFEWGRDLPAALRAAGLE
jgi:ketosteroid isomerase-like protein